MAIIRAQLPNLDANLANQIVHVVQNLRGLELKKTPRCGGDDGLVLRSSGVRRQGFKGSEDRSSRYPRLFGQDTRRPAKSGLPNPTRSPRPTVMTGVETARHHLLGFVHYLRREGLRIGVQETIDALSAVSGTLRPDEKVTRTTLRALSCQQAEDWQRFDGLFDRYFFPESIEPEISPAARIDPRLRRRGVVGLASTNDEDSDHTRLWGSGAGRQMTITRADYRFLNDRKAMEEAERMAERLALLLRARRSRRRVCSHRGRRLDLRRTLRKNLATGGLPVRRLYNDNEMEPVTLLVLHDISHSMTWHNPLLYRFVRGLVRTFRQVEAFAFHTRLFRVTELYREPSVARLKEKLDAREGLWMGGTCIAESIERYIRDWSFLVRGRNTIALILSDGFDTDEPERLAHALARLRRDCRTLVWLNPMLGREGFKLDGDSMLAALPHLDLLASAHSIEALANATLFIRDAHRSMTRCVIQR